VDADGVALAAIQGLYTVVQEKDAALAEQAAALDAQSDRISALEDTVAALRAQTPVAATNTLLLVGVLVAGIAVGAGLCLGAFALGQKRAG
jgi:hypothetical protein